MDYSITYDHDTREIFEPTTREILDLLLGSYPNVKVECKDDSYGENRWFVQVAKSDEHLAVGFFGSTVKEGALRIASALKIELPLQ